MANIHSVLYLVFTTKGSCGENLTGHDEYIIEADRTDCKNYKHKAEIVKKCFFLKSLRNTTTVFSLFILTIGIFSVCICVRPVGGGVQMHH